VWRLEWPAAVDEAALSVRCDHLYVLSKRPSVSPVSELLRVLTDHVAFPEGVSMRPGGACA
jgi:hypothetical protein